MTETKTFQAVPSELDFPKYEARILELWKDQRIIERALARDGDRSFVFYEGPPTANGLPHNGHVLTRAMKDLFPRYHAMQGAKVLRKGGWDTHGLPVEVEVEKELKIHGKAAIQEYGVKPFVSRCIESVFRYTKDWTELTERIGFWVNLEEAYVTYHRSYVESVWWALGELFKRDLLYQGHKVVWWWAQGGTALSSGEVGQGYKTVDDPSVYCLFPLVEDADTSLVVWTTTPWTLPSNGYAAVRASYDYDIVEIGSVLPSKKKSKGKQDAEPPPPPALATTKLIVASKLREALSTKLGFELTVLETVKGSELIGKRYKPPFGHYYERLGDTELPLKAGGTDHQYWRVLGEDFVTTESGTGIVHIAPAFGEDDHTAHRKQLARYAVPAEEVELICAIETDGTFKADVANYAGKWVKDADREIIAELKDNRLLFHDELYRHEYPFCWRASDDPLIQMARPAWFIRTTEKLQGAIENNQAVNWLPEHIKAGRMGDFLENNVDWALSRERFWGTPLNVWICPKCDHRAAPDSVEAIEALNPTAFDPFREAKKAEPELSDHLMVHKPWIDEVTLPCEKCQATMQRVPEVIDCWFDSGCMPFAQWGFPHKPGSKQEFAENFPADFISEGLDQTRGWFYSLLMIATLVFDEETRTKMGLPTGDDAPYPFPYKTCIVLGLVCDREGKKESKSIGNYTPPEIIMDRVKMDFAVLSEAHGKQAKLGEVLIGREDLEGMDLKEGAEVALMRPDKPEERAHVKIRVEKKLPRRVALVHADVVAQLGLREAESGVETLVRKVPELPATERVSIEDENTPAPGADAFRWFFYAASPPWNNTRHSLRNVRMLQKDFVVKLRNVYSFFTIYANIDGWSPSDDGHAGAPVADRALLDRWMLSELNLAVRDVRDALDRFHPYDAAQRLVELVEGLSNWYVRRSRSRFWAKGLEQDKRDAYATLYEALETIARVVAPFVPFFSEEMYQNLVVHAGARDAEPSVHLAKYPVADVEVIDERLAVEMRAVRDIVSLGLSVRTAAKRRVRQPLAQADVLFNDEDLMAVIGERYADLITEELNVLELKPMSGSHEAVEFEVKPNFRALGPRLGKRVQAVKKALAKLDGTELVKSAQPDGSVSFEVDGELMQFSSEEIQVAVVAKDGFAAKTGGVGVVVLHTTLTDDLIDRGLLREVVSRIQALRKDRQLEFTDRVRLGIDGTERLVGIVKNNESVIRAECLATDVAFEVDGDATEHTIGDELLKLTLSGD